MTDKEAMKLVKILENIEDYRVTITAAHELRRLHFENKALKERLADPMREVQRLGQEIEQEPVAHPERHELQAKGEHPAPCARHCEANAFQIVIKNLKAQLAQPEQEPEVDLQTRWPMNGWKENKSTPPQRTEPLIGCVNHDCDKCREKNT